MESAKYSTLKERFTLQVSVIEEYLRKQLKLLIRWVMILVLKEGLKLVFKDWEKIRATFDPTGKVPIVNAGSEAIKGLISFIILAGIVFIVWNYFPWKIFSTNIPDDMSGTYRCYKNENIMGSNMTLNATITINKSSDGQWRCQYNSIGFDGMSGQTFTTNDIGKLELIRKIDDTYRFWFIKDGTTNGTIMLDAYVFWKTKNWRIEWGEGDKYQTNFDKQ